MAPKKWNVPHYISYSSIIQKYTVLLFYLFNETFHYLVILIQESCYYQTKTMCLLWELHYLMKKEKLYIYTTHDFYITK